MRPGTNTAIYFKALDDPNTMDELEIVERLHNIGFQTLDFSLADPFDPRYILRGDDCQQKVDKVVDKATKYGMSFSQVHLPFIRGGNRDQDPHFKEPGYAEYYDESMRRAYIAASMAGAPWAVAHCCNFPSDSYDRSDSFKGNHEYYDKYVELGIKNGVGTAFENMIQGTKERNRIRFTGHYSDLIDYVDSYNEPMVKICWDFGHANESGYNQVSALRKVGKRLACVHVNDNYRNNDDHIVPFSGTIDWLSIIPVLAEIGYTGDCSLEVGQYTKKPPRALQDSFVRVAFEACSHLCMLFDQEVAKRKD